MFKLLPTLFLVLRDWRHHMAFEEFWYSSADWRGALVTGAGIDIVLGLMVLMLTRQLVLALWNVYP